MPDMPDMPKMPDMPDMPKFDLKSAMSNLGDSDDFKVGMVKLGLFAKTGSTKLCSSQARVSTVTIEPFRLTFAPPAAHRIVLCAS